MLYLILNFCPLLCRSLMLTFLIGEMVLLWDCFHEVFEIELGLGRLGGSVKC